MNPKGHKPNLKAAQPGNRNAESTGLYSERRRSEKTETVRENLNENPAASLEKDTRDRYAELQAVSKLYQEYLIANGVTDRHGKQRRQAGSYLRTLAMLESLAGQIRRGLASAALNDDNGELWDEGAIRRRLQAIADDPNAPAGARVAALRLLRETAPSAELPYDIEFYEELHNKTDEELERELAFLLVPLTTGRPRGPAKSRDPETLHEIIKRLSAKDTLENDDVVDIYNSLHKLFNPPSPWPTSADVC